jgi:F-type H+-transporting ATPase subunit delta
MTVTLAVKRSTRALFDVAEAAGDADRVAGELEALARAMQTDPGVARALGGPALTAERRVEAVRRVAEGLGFSDITARLLVLLAGRGELALVPDFATAFHDLLLERRNIVTAEMTTAVALPPDRVEALARRLGEVTGKRIELQTRVDPSIIGGVVTRVGSLVYDGSVTGQLARLRRTLVETV